MLDSNQKPTQLFEIFEYSFKRNIYKEGTVSQYENVAVCSAVVNYGLNSSLFLKSLYWATMVQQVLEEYNSLPITQTTSRVPQNC